MQRYVDQLIEDLEGIAEEQHTIPYIEPPPELEEFPDISELALIPYKTIEEWTGIDQIRFPHSFHLSDEQISLILSAIFKLLDSFEIELVDKPNDIPNEFLYDILVDSWVDYVQYLPSSSFDWEICTGDPDTCPYLDYCNCKDDFIEDDPPASFTSDEDFEIPL